MRKLIIPGIGITIILITAIAVIFYRSETAARQADEAQAALKQLQQQTAEQFKQMQQQIAVIQVDRQRLQAENAALQQKVAARQAIIEQQKQQLAQRLSAAQTLPLTGVASRWAELTGMPAGELHAGANDILVSGSAARTTLDHLERLPAAQQQIASLQSDKVDLQAQVSNDKQVIAGWEQQYNLALAKQKSLDAEHAAEMDVATKQLAACKASARASKFKWGVVGAIAGFIVKVVLH